MFRVETRRRFGCSGSVEKLPSKTDVFSSSGLTASHSQTDSRPVTDGQVMVHSTHSPHSPHLTSSHGAASNHSSPVIGFGFNHPSILIPELKVVFFFVCVFAAPHNVHCLLFVVIKRSAWVPLSNRCCISNNSETLLAVRHP